MKAESCFQSLLAGDMLVYLDKLGVGVCATTSSSEVHTHKENQIFYLLRKEY